MAFNLYAGISEQIYCNAHPVERSAIDYWLNVYMFVPNKSEFRLAWRLWWTLNGSDGESRRILFEDTYGLTEYEGYVPGFQEKQNLIRVETSDYWNYLQGEVSQGGIQCSGKLYPQWP